MEDRVDYALPFGPLGRLVHRLPCGASWKRSSTTETPRDRRHRRRRRAATRIPSPMASVLALFLEPRPRGALRPAFEAWIDPAGPRRAGDPLARARRPRRRRPRRDRRDAGDGCALPAAPSRTGRAPSATIACGEPIEARGVTLRLRPRGPRPGLGPDPLRVGLATRSSTPETSSAAAPGPRRRRRRRPRARS